MRIIIPSIIAAGLAASGCATQKTVETVLNVCSSGNGTVKSATVVKSSGDAQIDQHAIEKVGKQMVYQESSQLACRPLTVEYNIVGEKG